MSAIPQTYKCDAEGCIRRYDVDCYNGQSDRWVALTGTQVFNATMFNNVAEKLEGTKHACCYDHACQLFANWFANTKEAMK